MRTLAALAVLTAAGLAHAGETPSPEGAEVYIIAPADGATVQNPVTIQFGLKGMGVAPAGIEKENTGHHHLVINLDPSDVDMASSLPADENHVHFGGGQTEFTGDLPAGTHTMWLLLADHNHAPHNPPVMSEPITITVE